MSDYLPHEVVTDILAKLPVKSLLRFRCVCQKWCSLISSPNFISQHLSHSSSSPTVRTLVRHYSKPRREIYTVFNNDTFTVETTGITFPAEGMFDWEIVGYSNGVFCLSDFKSSKETIILWNPSIRQSINVPTLRVTIADYDFNVFALGFEFDSVSNDYKIVKVSYLLRDGYKFPPKIEVFSVSVGNWRLIESSVPGIIHKFSSSQAVKENVLHWIGHKATSSRGTLGGLFIVSFHLNTEIFGEMSLPNPLECLESLDRYCMLVAVLKGLLSVLSYNINSTGRSYSIWVMKEYGNSNSWVNQYNIDIEGGRLVGVLSNALLVASRNGELLSYNYEKRTSTVTGICGMTSANFAVTYVESLVLVSKGREIPKNGSELDNGHEDRLVKKMKVTCSS